MGFTPIDLKVKEHMREFLKNRMAHEKMQTAFSAVGFVVREVELEKFLDDMWVHINSAVLKDQNDGSK